MKYLPIVLLCFLLSRELAAQVVAIPDTNFLKALIDEGVDDNNDGMIQLSEAEVMTRLDVSDKNIDSLDGISSFINLDSFYCRLNNFSRLNLEGLTGLTYLNFFDNHVSDLDLSHTPSLKYLHCNYNNISELDLSYTPSLITLDCSFNSLTELDLSQTPLLDYLWCRANNFTTMNLGHTPLLEVLACDLNNISVLDLSQIPLLKKLNCASNELSSLDVNHTSLLTQLACGNNSISSLDLSNSPLLTQLTCSNNNITTIDLNSNPLVDLLICEGNDLSQLFLKNGNTGLWRFLIFDNNEFLTYICSDNADLILVQQKLDEYGYTDVVINTYCSFNPGGDYSEIKGNSLYDLNNTGCQSSDVEYPFLNLLVTDGLGDNHIISNGTGAYYIPVANGDYAVRPLLENPLYFSIDPDSFQVSFPSDSSPHIQDFCITSIGVFNDLDVVILPITAARPGFESNYKISYHNKGTTTRSGHLMFLFDDNLMDFITTSQPADTTLNGYFSWNYTDLLPFESRSIVVSFELNSPLDVPPLIDDDVIDFSARIYPITDDETPADNSFTLSQTVVNSFDPNDKTCLEGNSIKPEIIGEYVHYLIRFENTGTASAVNIVVKDVINTNMFDINTLHITDASHEVVTRIRDESIVEFIFENIYLEFEDDINDGYIAFKIKTQPDLIFGDQLVNSAEIYFDFNAPIITNEATSTIDENSSVSPESNSKAHLIVYPNPFRDMINVSSVDGIEAVHIFDTKGKLIRQLNYNERKTEVRISTRSFSSGLYLLEIVTEKKVFLNKLIK